MKTEKFFVVPYRLVKGRPQPGEPRPARGEEHAAAMAERLAEHWAGAVAVGVIVDDVTEEVESPREVAAFGVGVGLFEQQMAA